MVLVQSRFGGNPACSLLTKTTTLPALLRVMQRLKCLEFYPHFSIRHVVARNYMKIHYYKVEAPVRLRRDMFHVHTATHRFPSERRSLERRRRGAGQREWRSSW